MSDRKYSYINHMNILYDALQLVDVQPLHVLNKLMIFSISWR